MNAAFRGRPDPLGQRVLSKPESPLALDHAIIAVVRVVND